MTSYGTIPTQSPSQFPSSNLYFISLAEERIGSSLGDRRPWREMAGSLSIPSGLNDSLSRIKTNVVRFHMNYVISIMTAVFLGLLWHPTSLIVFVIMTALWLFLYFLREAPVVLFDRTLDDRLILAVLSSLTLAALFLTDATKNLMAGLSVGTGMVLVHALSSSGDWLSVDEEGGGGGEKMVLKETASSSFSASS